MYEPIWEAASRHGLPVALHVNSGERRPWLTPVGFPRYWSEYHAVMYPLTYAAQLVSLVCDGVFERYDNLRVVFVEGGFHWAAPLIERLVASGRHYAGELAGRTAPTREFIAEHVRFTSMPVEDAPPEAMVRSLELSGADRMLMLASDYPHWDADDPTRALPGLAPEVEARIYHQNAGELYGLTVDTAQ
jgi:predicted TIM-barrel fold metal-dependent hydrolase